MHWQLLEIKHMGMKACIESHAPIGQTLHPGSSLLDFRAKSGCHLPEMEPERSWLKRPRHGDIQLGHRHHAYIPHQLDKPGQLQSILRVLGAGRGGSSVQPSF